MKRIVNVMTMLMCIVLCVSAFAEPKTDDGAVDMTGIKRISLTTMNGNVQLEPSDDGKVRCEYDPELFNVDLRVQEDTLLITVNSQTDSKPETKNNYPIALHIPQEGLDVFELDAENADFFPLPITIPLYSDWKIRARNQCWITIIYVPDSAKSIEIEMEGNCLGELIVYEKADDYAIDFKLDDKSYITTRGGFPEYDGSGVYKYVSGDGNTKITASVNASRLELNLAKMPESEMPNDSGNPDV